MSYRDFVLRLSVKEGETYRAVVTQSPFGTGLGDFQIPPGLEGYRLPHTSAVRPVSRDLSPDFHAMDSQVIDPLHPEIAGRALFDALFQGKIGELFLKSQDPQHGLRIKLVLQEANDNPAALKLYGLPWELLFDHQFIAVNAGFSLVRSLDGDAITLLAPATRSFSATLKVLMVGSNPNDTNPLETERELRLLEAMSSANIHFEALQDISRRGLHQKLEEGFHAVHFCGHGDCVDGEPVLFFLDEYGDAEGVSGRALAEEIRALNKVHWPKLFVLNACHGGAMALGPAGLTGIAAELHRAGLPVVVAMRQEVGDEAAIAFSQAFYQSIAKGNSVDEAMVKGRLSLKRETNFALDWATPCLFSHLDDGRLFPKSEPQKEATALKNTSSERPKMGRLKRALWPVIGVAIVAALTLFLMMRPREGDIRLALAPFALNEEAGGGFVFETMDLKIALSGIKGLVVVESGADVELFLNNSNGENALRALLKKSEDGQFLASREEEFLDSNQAAAHADRVEWLIRFLLDSLKLDTSADSVPLKPVPAGAMLQNSKAMTYFSQGDLPRAEDWLREAIEQFPEYAAAHANLAVILHNQARSDEALHHFNRAVELVPNFALFHYHQGQCLVKLQRKEEAEVAFAKATELDPYAFESFHELAKIHLSQKDWGEAGRLLDVAIRIRPETSVLHKTKGKLWVERGWPKRAIMPLEKALELTEGQDTPQLGEIFYLLAKANFEINQPKPAGTAVLSFLKLPGARFLPNYAVVEEIRLALDLDEPILTEADDTWVSAPKAAPWAYFIKLEGSFTISGDTTWPASLYAGVQKGMKISADQGAKAVMVCFCGTIKRLTGPETWPIDDVFCGDPGSQSGALLYQQLLAKTSRESSPMGTLLKMATRPAGSDEFVILSPLGKTFSEEPQILWTHVPGAVSYKVVTDMGFGATPTEVVVDDHPPRQMVVGHQSLPVMSLAWPDYALSFDTHFTVRIFVSLAPGDRRIFDAIRLDAEFLDEPTVSSLQTQLESLDNFDQDPALQTDLAAGFLAEHKVWGDAWQKQQELLQLREQAGDRLQLARFWLEAGLDRFSRELLTELTDVALTPTQRAVAEQAQGILALRANEYSEARSHLGRARALFQHQKNAIAVFEVDQALSKAEAGMTAQLNKETEGPTR